MTQNVTNAKISEIPYNPKNTISLVYDISYIPSQYLHSIKNDRWNANGMMRSKITIENRMKNNVVYGNYNKFWSVCNTFWLFYSKCFCNNIYLAERLDSIGWND